MQIKRVAVISSINQIAVAEVSDNQPQDTIKGLLWVDTSDGNFVLKIYDGATWRVVQADVYLTKIDGGSL
jgi:hypothetical protein